MQQLRTRCPRWSPSAGAILGIGIALLLTVGTPAFADDVEITANVDAPTTWTSDNVYCIRNGITVVAGVTLTIEAGTVVKLDNDVTLEISGAISAVGNDSEKIVFTSYRDDEFGGDTNGDGDSSGQPGDWERIRVLNTATAAVSAFEDVIIRYGGDGNNGCLHIDAVAIPITDCEISDSSSLGLYVQFAAPDITDLDCHDNATYGMYLNIADATVTGGSFSDNGTRGVYLRNNSPTLTGLTITGNGSQGIYNQVHFANSAPTVTDCTITDNGGNGVQIDRTGGGNTGTMDLTDCTITGNGGWGLHHDHGAAMPVVADCTITGNARGVQLPIAAMPGAGDFTDLAPNDVNEVNLVGGTRSTDLDLEVLYPGEAHEITRYQVIGIITLATGTDLVVAEGLTLKFTSGGGIVVNGSLTADGTADDKVVFTSIKDDAYGGDLNNDGYATRPAWGDWFGIYFTNVATDADCLLDHCIVRYAGSNASYDAAIYSFDTDMTISNTTVAFSSQAGIRSWGADLTLTDCDIYACNWHGLLLQSNGISTHTGGRIFANNLNGAWLGNSASLTITDCEIFGNVGNGVLSTSTGSVDASGNWWGTADGPGGEESGTGDEVSTGVTVDDFVTTGPDWSYLNAGPNATEGTIVAPTVTAGTDTEDFGSTATTRALFDLETVTLDYGTVDSTTQYELLITYYNTDNTASVGGNVQTLTDADGTEIHGPLTLPSTSARTFHYRLDPASFDDDTLTLNFNRVSGVRAVVSQVWLVERPELVVTDAPTASITSPSASDVLTGGTVTVEGDTTDTGGSGILLVEVGIDDGSGIDWRPATVQRADGTWSYSWTLGPDGAYTLYARACDVAGNLGAASAGVAVTVDQTPPAPVTMLSAHDTPSDSGGSITLIWVLSADDGGGSDDVEFYQVERADAGMDNFISVDDYVVGTASITDGTVTDGDLHDYRITVLDEVGNASIPMVYGPILAIDNDGSDSTAPDDVTGLTATEGDAFMFLEWTPSVDTNLDLLTQHIDLSVDGGTTFGTNDPDYDDGATIDIGKLANTHFLDLTNGTEYVARIRVEDTSGNMSAGVTTLAVTPASDVVNDVSGTISTDTTWAAGVYHVTSNVTVSSGVTLTINPGVVVKFDSSRQLQVNGTLLAIGESGSEIVFTAWTDDDHGGDSNGDGASDGTRGYWNRVYLNNSPTSVMEYCLIRYGGSGNSGNVHVLTGAATLRNCISEEGSSYGFRFWNSSPIVDTCTARDNDSDGMRLRANFGDCHPVITDCTVSDNGGHGIRPYRTSGGNTSAPTISGCTITDNVGRGILHNHGAAMPEITDCTITGNAVPIRLPFFSLPGPGSGNVLTPNDSDQWEIIGSTLTREMTLTDDQAYYLVSGLAVVGTGVRFTLDPGVVWKFGPGTELEVQGALNATGTGGDPIVFTSYRDDDFGGDTNGDGASSGERDDWNRLYFSPTAVEFASRIEECIIRYAGSANEGAFFCDDVAIPCINTEITECGTYGFYVENASPDVTDCVFSRNSLYGMYLNASSAVVIGCEITDNDALGVYLHNSSATLDSCDVLRNAGQGVYQRVHFANSAAVVNLCTISDNDSHGYQIDRTGGGNTGTVDIDDCTITDNGGWGLHVDHSSQMAILEGTTITGNGRGVQIPINAMPATSDGNTLAPNDMSEIRLTGGTRTTDLTLETLYGGEAHEINRYYIIGTVTVDTGVTLTVDAGLTLKFSSQSGIVVNGAISALGTADDKIVFTSILDDLYGGDLNGDGYATQPTKGYWAGIYLTNLATDADCEFDHCILRYGGGNTSWDACIYSFDTDVPISNTVVAFSGHSGIRAWAADLTLTDCEIYASNWYGFRSQSSGSHTITGGRIYANLLSGARIESSSALTISDCEIFGNLSNGVTSVSSGIVDASGNWWGAADGPGGEESGSGDQVSTGVTVDDFLTTGSEWSYLNAGPNLTEGTIVAPTVTAGTDTTEFGTSSGERALFDLDTVTLDYSTVDSTTQYELLVTYYNEDDTAAVGGNVQNLTDADGLEIHGNLTVSSVTPQQEFYRLPTSSYDDDTLTLNFNRVSGFRSVVSEVWLVERVAATDAPTTTITSPAAGALVTGDSLEITGTTTDADDEATLVEISVDDGSTVVWHPASSLLNDGTWSFLWTLPADGAYTVSARAVDVAGNTGSSSAAITINVDRTPPRVASMLVASDTPLDSGGSIDVSWDLSPDDGAGSDDVDEYELSRSLADLDDFSIVLTVTDGVSSATDATTVDGELYDYRLVVIDDAGNRSDPAQYGPILSIDNDGFDTIPPDDVTGLSATVGDEFAFLEWTSSVDTDLDLLTHHVDASLDGGSTFGANAPLFDDGGTIEVSKLATTYFLEGLTNGLEHVLRVRVEDSSGNTSAGATTGGLTPEADLVNEVSGAITTDTTWAAGVYHVTGNLTVNSGVTLTINPGVIVKIGTTRSITVTGTLLALGESGTEIVFTAWTDDDHGGDSNGDGSSSGTRGYWNRINISDSPDTIMEHCLCRYGGSGGSGNVYVVTGDATLRNVISEESSSYGFQFWNSSPSVDTCTARNNSSDGMRLRANFDFCRPVITDCTVTDNDGQGIRAHRSSGSQSCEPTIADCTITDNAGRGIFHNHGANMPEISGCTITGNAVPLRLPFSSIPGPGSGNVLTPNTNDRWEFIGSTLAREFTLTADREYYVIDGTIRVGTGVRLDVDPGVVMKFAANTGLTVDGAINAEGTESDKIVFTSYRDDTTGTDTNGDGPSEGQADDWNRIHVTPTAIAFLSRLEHCSVRYAGDTNNAAVYIDGVSMTVASTEIRNSSSYGLYAQNSSPTITDCTMTHNTLFGLYMINCGSTITGGTYAHNSVGLYLHNSSVTLDGCTAEQNAGQGVYHRVHFANSATVVTGCTITDNGSHGYQIDRTGGGNTGSADMDDCTITGNDGWGLHTNHGSQMPILEDMTITGNTRGVQIPVSAMPGPGDGNELAPNETSEVRLVGSTRDTDLTLEILYPGEAHEINRYYVTGVITVASGTHMDIDPGLTLKFTGSGGIVVQGSLAVLGTADDRVVLTSSKDDRGGDDNGDGYASSPRPGDWTGVYFANATDADCELDYCDVLYGGSNSTYDAALYVWDTDMPISNTVAAFSSSSGIRTWDSEVTITDSDAYANVEHGLKLESSHTITVTGGRYFANALDGVRVRHSVGLTMSDAEIFTNFRHGVNTDSSGSVDVSGNWWGAADGPGGDESGSGDELIATSVTVDDFLTDGTEFSFFNAGDSDHVGFGIDPPNVDGTASTEFGTGPAQSILYTLENVPLTAEYGGLDGSIGHTLILWYLNQDNPGVSTQRLSDSGGQVLHPPMPLSLAVPMPVQVALSPTLVDGGNASLDLERTDGLRTVVSALLLLKGGETDSSGPVVHLSSPADGSVFGLGNRIVSGTVSDAGTGVADVEIGIEQDGVTDWLPVTTLTNDGLWSHAWNQPAGGEYTLRARATDLNGNLATAPEVVMVTIDAAAPAPASIVFATDVDDDPPTIRLLWNLSADDGDGADDVTGYAVRRRALGDLTYSQVGTVPAGTTEFEDTTAVLDEAVLYVIRTNDATGASSDSEPFGPVVADAVLDGDPPEDVTGLTAYAAQLDGAQLSVYTLWTPSVNSAGDLVDQRMYISRDDGVTFGNNAPDFDNGDSFSLGPDATSYQEGDLVQDETYTFRVTTVDLVGNESAGVDISATPTGDAGETVPFTGTVDSDRTLLPGVYEITSNVTIASGVTVTVEAGVVFKFLSTRQMIVSGALVCNGTVDTPVVFTARTDDDYGGDTNGDGPSSGTRGYWHRVYLNNSPASNLEHCLFRYGGSGSNGNLYILTGDATVRNCISEESSTYGIHCWNSSPILDTVTCRNNDLDGLRLRANFGHCNPVITDGSFHDNGGIGIRGYRLSGSPVCAPTISGCTVTDNASYGIHWNHGSAMPPLTGNTITGNLQSLRIPMSGYPDDTNTLVPNTRPVIGITGGTTTGDLTLRRWGVPDTPDEIRIYRMAGDITVESLNILTIEAGLFLKFEANIGITVNGALVADGSSDSKIYFTAFSDDVAGDTNGDGTLATTPVPGYWDGISFFSSFFDDVSVLRHCIVRYAGVTNSSAIYIQQADIRLEDTVVSNSSSYGVYSWGASPTISGCSIWGHKLDGILIQSSGTPEITFTSISTCDGDAVQLDHSSDAVVTNCQVFQNRGLGIRNNTSNEVDATSTWWGDTDSSGPFHPVDNDTGTGMEVTNNVDFDPFETDVGTEFVYKNFSEDDDPAEGSLDAPTLDVGTLSDEWDPSSERPDRTMAWDTDAVEVSFTGLDTEGRYKVRVSYFNDDATDNEQSLTDDDTVPNLIHGTRVMPTSTPVQYEWSIPTSLTDDGDITLVFVHDNPGTSIRCALPEVWLMEDIDEFSPPLFTALLFNDVDGSESLTEGDEYHFLFSEEMDTALLVDGTTDANDKLLVDGGGIYGTTNQSAWSGDRRSLVVTVTEGFTIDGDELVTPTALTDLAGNEIIGSQNLTTTDTVAPNFVDVTWNDADASAFISEGDEYTFHFDEAMLETVIEDGTTDANFHLRPFGGKRYGDTNDVSWNDDGTECTVTITSGYTVLGNELVIPSGFVTDVGGNSVVGTQVLLGIDQIPPEFASLIFEDADGSGGLSIGDWYRFGFTEAMRQSPLSDGTAEANLNLPPEDRVYGTVNEIQWNEDGTEVTVGITSGSSAEGDELVTPTLLVTDLAGNALTNDVTLTVTDTVAPELLEVEANLVLPVGAVGNFRLTLRFSSTMDDSTDPTVVLNSPGTDPVVDPGGTWITTLYPDDTYVTPDIVLAAGMDGTITVDVSSARDVAANVMDPVIEAFTFELDATPPDTPAFAIVDTDCDTVTLGWDTYVEPPDLAGYQVFAEETPFSDVVGLTPVAWLNPGTVEIQLVELSLGTTQHLAVVARDEQGNRTTAVTPVTVDLDATIPGPIAITVSAGVEPGSARIAWDGYDTSGFCGFDGFRLYSQPADFSDVSGLVADQTVGPDGTEFLVDGLDRAVSTFFAVVGFNVFDEQDDSVTAGEWSDPFSGEITEDTVIGGGSITELDIPVTMTVNTGVTVTIVEGTTLHFLPGASLLVNASGTVEIGAGSWLDFNDGNGIGCSGKIIADGTALDPITLTSAEHTDADSPAVGDWTGVNLFDNTDESLLRHVFLLYGQGLTLDEGTCTVEAITLRDNELQGLGLLNGADLTTTWALITDNDVGIITADTSTLDISASVIKLNTTNADGSGTETIAAGSNWWGTPDGVAIAATVTGLVDTPSHLTEEPLLTPAIGPDNGLTVGTQTVDLRLACRTAEEMRVSEDSTFTGVFFDTFAPTTSFELSPGAGSKEVFVQYKSSTGNASTPVSVVLELITDGPSIDSFSLSEGDVLERPLDVSATASAALGLDSLELFLDDELLASSATSPLEFEWDVREYDNGIRRLRLEARDTVDNLATLSLNVTLDVAPPPAPVITEPADGLVLGAGPVTIEGTAEPDITVRVKRDGGVVASVVADSSGDWMLADVDIFEGTNTFTAVAEDDIGTSPNSNAVDVELDTGAPEPPVLLTPVRLGGNVLLQWVPPAEGEVPDRYNLFRSTAPFSIPLETYHEIDIVDLDFTDTIPADGTYYYAVVSLDVIGNVSGISNVDSITIDTTPPAFELVWSLLPPFGVEDAEFTLTSTEALLFTPTVAILPFTETVPTIVPLAATDDTTWTGTYSIDADTTSGVAQLQVSGQDFAGNSFVGEPLTVELVIDTDGPTVSVATDPDSPVQNQSPTLVDVTLTLDEDARSGTSPTLEYQPPIGSSVAIGLSGSGTDWTGSFTVTPEMGDGFGTFSFSAEDALANLGTSITSGHELELYTGDLPPPPLPPINVETSLSPDGNIQIHWDDPGGVDIDDYTVYRAADADPDPPATLVASGIVATEYVDLPPVDGIYRYAVTSTRLGAESDQSLPSVEGSSDRTAPDPPVVSTELTASGIRVSWTAPVATDVDEYQIYRGLPLTSPFATLAESLGVLFVDDSPPEGGTVTYTVVAVDLHGNEGTSDSVEVDLEVGTVQDVVLEIVDDEPPTITWVAPNDGDLDGFNVYKGSTLIVEVQAETDFTDNFYTTGSVVEYGISAVDLDGNESLIRTVRAFPLDLALHVNPDDADIERAFAPHLFNELVLDVTNNSSDPFPYRRAELTIEGVGSQEVLVEVESDEPPQVEMVLPGDGIGAGADATMVVESLEIDGSLARYVHVRAIDDVALPGAVVTVTVDEPPLAGGFATFNVCVTNLGYADLDIVAARGSGNDPGDVRVTVFNGDGLELVTGKYAGLPAGASIRPGGTVLVTLERNEEVCLPITVLIPEALPADAILTIDGVVDTTYHAFGTADQVTGPECTGSMNSGVVLSPYFGSAEAAQDVYTNNEDIVITGQAIDRETGDPRANVPLKLGFLIRGFHWFRDVETDEFGDFEFTYNPPVGLAGEFTIWAAHPDVFDLINQDQFTVYRLYATPAFGDVRMSKADTFHFTIKLVNPGRTPLTGFTSSVEVVDDLGDPVPEVTGDVEYGEDFELKGNEKRNVTLSLTADIDAPDEVEATFEFLSAQGASTTFVATVSLVEAAPLISVVTPVRGFVQVSVDRGRVVRASVQLQNKGLDDFLDVELVPPETETWVQIPLATQPDGSIQLGDIPVGAKRTFDVVFAPPDDLDFEFYGDEVTLIGTNSEGTEFEFTVGVFALVTSDLTGNVLFHVRNILQDPDDPEVGLEGATVRMSNRFLFEDPTPVKTDAVGEATVEDLQEGVWDYQVSAPGHATVTGTVTVLPDDTVLVEPVLSRSIVSITFSVVPVPFEDRYEIVISQTFETFTPVPAMVLDPPFFAFEDLEEDLDITLFPELTNIGLRQICDVELFNDVQDFGTLEPLITFMPALAAMETVEVPYKLTVYIDEIGVPGGDPVLAGGGCGGLFSGEDFRRGMQALTRGAAPSFRTLLNITIQVGLRVALARGAALFHAAALIGGAIGCYFSDGGGGNFGGGGGGGGEGPGGPGTSISSQVGPGCFAAGTPVTLADGSRLPIEEVTVGTEVRAFNGDPERVTRTFKFKVDHTREVWFDVMETPEQAQAGRLETTDTHYFYELERGWVRADMLRVGDSLLMEDANVATVTRSERLETPRTVYSFNVQRSESYYVSGVLVHQRCRSFEVPLLAAPGAGEEVAR